MFIADERKDATVSLDVKTFDDFGGTTGHVAVVLRDGIYYLTGAHDNNNSSFEEYQFLVPLTAGQDFEELLYRVDDISIKAARELFYYFPETKERLVQLAVLLGLSLLDGDG